MSSAYSHSPAAVLGEYLTAQSKLAGHTLRINGGTSETPHKQLIVSDTAAIGTRSHMSGAVVEFPGIQIRARGLPDDQLSPRDYIITLADYLDRVIRVPVTLDSTTYMIHAIRRSSAVLPLLPDDQRRWSWTWNGTLTLTQTT